MRVFRSLLLLVLVLVLVLVQVLVQASRRTHAVSLVLDQDQGGEPGRTVRLVLDPAVLGGGGGSPGSSIANMSLSPWTYRDSVEASRLPRRISEAQCLTSGCLNLQGGQDAGLEAKPVYYQVLVFYRIPKPSRCSGNNKKKKKKKKKKEYDLRLGTEMIPVGCTCVKPGIVPQQ